MCIVLDKNARPPHKYFTEQQQQQLTQFIVRYYRVAEFYIKSHFFLYVPETNTV